MCSEEGVGFFVLFARDVFLDAKVAIFGRGKSEIKFMLMRFIKIEGSEGLSGVLSADGLPEFGSGLSFSDGGDVVAVECAINVCFLV
jgi:hypothetical protein